MWQLSPCGVAILLHRTLQVIDALNALPESQWLYMETLSSASSPKDLPCLACSAGVEMQQVTRTQVHSSSWVVSASSKCAKCTFKGCRPVCSYQERAAKHKDTLLPLFGAVRSGAFPPLRYLRPCNAINDPASTSVQPTSSSSRSSSEPPPMPSTSSSSNDEGTDRTGLATDKWEETLAVHHTLSSLYLRTVKVSVL